MSKWWRGTFSRCRRLTYNLPNTNSPPPCIIYFLDPNTYVTYCVYKMKSRRFVKPLKERNIHHIDQISSLVSLRYTQKVSNLHKLVQVPTTTTRNWSKTRS